MKFYEDHQYQIVLKEIERNLRTRVDTENLNNRSELLSRYLQQGVDYTFRLKFMNAKSFLVFCALSWYLEENLRILVQLELIDHWIFRFGPDYQIKAKLLLESESKMKKSIIEFNLLGQNPKALFGNLLGAEFQLKVLEVHKPRPKKTQRHRGYRDKGSLRLGSEYLAEERKDVTLLEQQLKLEESRKTLEDTFEFLSGFLD